MANGTHKYIPINQQNRLITPDKVYEVMAATMKHANHGYIQHIVDQIYKPRKIGDQVAKGEKSSTSRRKLFAILVMVDKPNEILSFIQEDIWDAHLPFRRTSNTVEWENDGILEVHQIPEIDRVVNYRLAWREVDQFEMYQWYFLAPVFELNSPTMEHHKLTKNTPLPFTFMEEDPDISTYYDGGFGVVRKVRIHPAHYDSKVGYNLFTTIRKLTNIAVQRRVSCCKESSIWGKD